MITKLTSLACALIGVLLAREGWVLVSLGGSVAYLVIGVAYIVTALLIWRRDPVVLCFFGLVVLACLAWAVIEVGVDWWGLLPRLGFVVLTGLWLSTRWLRKRLDRPARIPPRLGYVGYPLGVVALVAALGAISGDDHVQDAGKPVTSIAATTDAPAADWPHYGGGLSGQRFSTLDQITPANIGALEEAWRFQTGDMKRGKEVVEASYQATPLKIGSTLYICTPHSQVIALHATTGAEIWRFDAVKQAGAAPRSQTCRGVSYFDDPATPERPCSRRILLPAAGGRLTAIDAKTGALCRDFGVNGVVDLLRGLPHAQTGFFYNTSPPVVIRGKVIVGGAVSDSAGLNAPSGVIRAFDAVSGRLLWNWDSGNPEATKPIGDGEFYIAGSPNSWSISSADEELGLVYAPMGNRPPDQMGQGRSAAMETFSSAIVALDVETGRVRWSFQTVRHDLWDMDVPAQPSLFSFHTASGVIVPALAAPTKQGDIYILDRRTGAPLLPVGEAEAPASLIPGEQTAPRQPFSSLTFSPPALTETNMWGVTLFDQLSCRIRFQSRRYQGRYTPPSEQGTIVYPGNFGVFNWGGIAVDPERRILFGMPTYLAYVARLVPHEKPKETPPKRMKSVLIDNAGLRYSVRLGPFVGPLGVPCQAPPWGYVASADLDTGALRYRRVNGTVRDLTPIPLPFQMGVPGIGGPILTRGGVAFLAATLDDYIRGYDVVSGEELWRARLPAGGQATPMTYLDANGDQLVVIVAGGHAALETTPGDYVIAYRLPKAGEKP
ncbi:quinoprotein glucose dehydrogenase [Rhizobium sp. SG_E_25_P2]|uniref:membrane-bound PQQ-dependent dehydrogenase, glucose/quinate/shikimate family n=1 Tax=Rhizobium sp. SG_E_25_P2 TaxID=2879942 RepID=UPI002473E9B6|nr:membrane-bound PQQ-dependent dehydrogenase, glucose/quinate/shikimate family [Rhizobium sp. SG_E_25_P2]MDH6266364.1 quinoprotein glucose dehydrogenase [Rhizobium sp. SG_E_25_P2]